MRHIGLVTVLWSLGLLSSGFAAAADQSFASPPVARKATLAWQEADKAAKYEVELSTNRKFNPALKKQTVKLPQWTIELGAGTYFFRVRPVDAENLPGPWSDIEGFVVNPHGPEAVAPADGAVFREKLVKGIIKLEWTTGLHGTQSIIEIKDEQGPILKRTVDGNSFAWKPREPGSYQWRAGYVSIAGTEWSAFRSFLVLPEALGIAAAVVPPRAVAPGSLCQRVSLLGFQLGGMSAFQTSGGQTSSGFASWNPRCSVSPLIDLVFSLGVSAFRGLGAGTTDTKNISVLEYMGWAIVGPSAGSSFNFGFGGGAQTWVKYGTYARVGARMGLRPRLGWLPFAEEIFLEYGYLSASDPAQELKAGVVLRWEGK